MNVYDRLRRGESVSWRELDEQGRYDVWSLHIENGGAPFTFAAFCDHMDQKTTSETLTV